MGERTLAFRIDEKFHRDLKVWLAKKDVTLKDYVLGLIANDMYQNKHPLSVDELRDYTQQIHERSGVMLEMLNKK